MLVEDEALIAMDLEDVFRDQGYDVTGPFALCRDALAALTAGLPDVAVLDATLRDGPCLDLARELRRLGVPFLIYSGRDAFEEQPQELEGVPWIEKPSSLESVTRVARDLLKTGVEAAAPARSRSQA
jgi:DNA-binding response OmpR family regulator